MRSLPRKLANYWPVFIIAIVEIALFSTNYKPGTYLLGWDNLNPELNLGVALKRNIFGVWLEYRGLGLYDGMSHAAGFIHTVFVWFLRFFVSQNLIRYIVTFFLHGFGGLGVYVLLKQKFGKSVSLVGSLFYLLNPATIQMFYTPFEPFLFHFAALPWIAWSLWQYLTSGSRKAWFIFLLVSLLSTPQFFVPTILLPTALVLVCVSLVNRSAKRIVLAALGFLLVNAFWLLPYVYGLPRNVPVIAGAKINEVSSLDAFERNRAFGDIKNVLFLRGFSLDFTELGKGSGLEYVMGFWREFLPSMEATIAMSILLSLTGFGAVACLLDNKQRRGLGLCALALCIISTTFLANNTPVISQLTTDLRDRFPLLAEAYRFPYTKFSLLLGFSYSVLLAYGLVAVTNAIKILRNRAFILSLLASGLILFLSFPAFTGYFLYPYLRIQIPQEYFQLAEYFANVSPTARIATLPEFEYWSWKHYRWGYRGSGFLWQMIDQPLMDRAFDVWSRYNENYYWELSRAIYSKNRELLRAVLDKYDISYLLLDENRFSTSHNRALFLEDSKQMLSEIPDFIEAANFGAIRVYERIVPEESVSLLTNIPKIFPTYAWTDNDVAYAQYKNYVASDKPQAAITYPYRSLFTKRSVQEREFMIEDRGDELLIESGVVATSTAIPKVSALVNEASVAGNLQPNKVVPCGTTRDGQADAQELSDAGSTYLRFSNTNERNCLSFGTGELYHRDGYLASVESRNISGRPFLFSFINDTAKHVEIETYLPVEPTWQTSYLILPPLAFDGLGYTVYISNDSVGGEPSVNDIKTIKIYRIPYQELIQMHVGNIQPQHQGSSVDFSVKHPNPAYYKVSIRQSVDASENPTLVLSQSYDPGWMAFKKTPTFPFYEPLANHVLVNNWANAWLLEEQPKSADQMKYEPSTNSSEKANTESRRRWDESRMIVVFFWPQILEWIGFGLLPILFIWSMIYLKNGFSHGSKHN